MTEQFFKINFLFGKEQVLETISQSIAQSAPANYICVCDGVIMNNVHVSQSYREVINGGMFSICDSGYIPLYIKKIHKLERVQYAGSTIFGDIIGLKRYRMCFLGSNQKTLDGLKRNLTKIDSRISDMLFWELPYRDVDEFDYADIARRVEESNADIIWVALGAPKQEIFMSKLKPHLKRGVMIAVGAAFKFHSGESNVKRAPEWMIRNRLEFVYRIIQEPRKQIKRCWNIVKYLPIMLYQESLVSTKNNIFKAQRSES